MSDAGAPESATAGRRVWVTRASPGAEATAARLTDRGFVALVAPLLEVRPVDGGPVDLADVGALAFTSANGVAALAARSDRRDLPVYAVGAATARAAWAAGFSNVVSAGGDVAALAQAIHSAGAPDGCVFHAAPAEPAGDLVGALAAVGIPARAVTIYETAPVALGPETVARVASADAVLLHSPKAARLQARHLAEHPAGGLRALCLSDAVAAPLEGAGLATIRAAATPSETALLDLLESWPQTA